MISLRRRAVSPSSAPQSAVVAPGAEAYAGGTGPIGVLLCHGFTGSPRGLRPWAEHLQAAGFRVSVPRLPGHGTSWPEMNLTRWTDWYSEVSTAFAALEKECDQIFVAGLSMGGALALRLGEELGDRVSGLVLVNPAINLIDPRMKILPVMRIMGSLAGIANDIAKPGQDEGAYDRTPLHALYSQSFLWSAVRADLAKITQPLLVYRSLNDHVVDPSSVELITAGVRSEDQTYRELTRSYHVAILDYEAEEIFDGTVAFIRRLTQESTTYGPAQ